MKKPRESIGRSAASKAGSVMGYLISGAPKARQALNPPSDDEVIQPKEQLVTEPNDQEEEVNLSVEEITFIDETSIPPEQDETVSNPAGHQMATWGTAF